MKYAKPYVALKPVQAFRQWWSFPDVQIASSMGSNAPLYQLEMQAFELSTDIKPHSPTPNYLKWALEQRRRWYFWITFVWLLLCMHLIFICGQGVCNSKIWKCSWDPAVIFMTELLMLLSESPDFLEVQYWFLALSPAYRDVTRFSESFDCIIQSSVKDRLFSLGKFT